jgi:hypothetical protein
VAEAKDSASARPAPTREDRWRAIRERTTRGMLTYNAGGVVRLEGDLWAVRSATHGGFHRVDLDAETCTCEDFEHFGRANDVNCRHIYAVAIAHGTRRGQRPPCACINGWVYLTIEEDGTERVEAVPCRRCNA